MNDILSQKRNVRKLAFALRRQAHDAYSGDLATENLVKYVAGYKNNVISAYMPIHSEINCLSAMELLAKQSTVGVPIVVAKGQPLEFHRWRPEAKMKNGPFGISVPVDAELVVPSVIILPLLAFDARGYRLGYGGGFYDRTLENLRAKGPVATIGFAYEAQQIDIVPIESTDQVMDAVVTERGVITFGHLPKSHQSTNPVT